MVQKIITLVVSSQVLDAICQLSSDTLSLTNFRLARKPIVGIRFETKDPKRYEKHKSVSILVRDQGFEP